MEIIALDAHKRYSQVCVQNRDGRFLCEKRINHSKGAIKKFLSNWTPGAKVALETVGRHLAEASFWVLTRNEDYKKPRIRSGTGKPEVRSVSPMAV